MYECQTMTKVNERETFHGRPSADTADYGDKMKDKHEQNDMCWGNVKQWFIYFLKHGSRDWAQQSEHISSQLDYRIVSVF